MRFPERAGDCKTVAKGKHHIEHYRVEAACARNGNRIAASAGEEIDATDRLVSPPFITRSQ